MIEPCPSVEMRVLDPRLYDWGPPRYQTGMSAGIDMHACLDEPLTLKPQAPPVLIRSGIALMMGDANMAALLLARSGLGHKGVVLSQAVGTIDADYTAEILISAWLRNLPGSAPYVIQPGERIAQLVFVPIFRPNFTVVESFSVETDRGSGGFGSTGR